MPLNHLLYFTLAHVNDLNLVIDSSSKEAVPMQTEADTGDGILQRYVFNLLFGSGLPNLHQTVICYTGEDLQSFLRGGDIMDDAFVTLVLSYWFLLLC